MTVCGFGVEKCHDDLGAQQPPCAWSVNLASRSREGNVELGPWFSEGPKTMVHGKVSNSDAGLHNGVGDKGLSSARMPLDRRCACTLWRIPFCSQTILPTGNESSVFWE